MFAENWGLTIEITQWAFSGLEIGSWQVENAI